MRAKFSSRKKKRKKRNKIGLLKALLKRINCLQSDIDLKLRAIAHAIRVWLLYPASDRFFRSVEWQYLRLKTLTKYGAQCMKCLTRRGRMHVDHIKPRSKYPKLALSFKNLQVLCERCNLNKGNKNETDYRKKNRTLRRRRT
jgi:5-methylcytosine-specific restriction endonuclease McrA